MKVWWLINAALLVLPLVFLPHFLARVDSSPRVDVPLGHTSLGPWTVYAGLGEEFGRPIVLFRFCNGCFKHVKSARVVFDHPNGERFDRTLSGNPNRLTVHLPTLPPPGTAIRVAAESWGGQVFSASWTVPP